MKLQGFEMELPFIRKVCAQSAAFFGSEEGLVTVEWVALAGALAIGAITVGWLVLSGLKAPASGISNTMTRCQQSAAKNGGATTGC